jgi:hypothetical protein
VVPAEELDAQLEQLARLHKFTAVNTAKVREAIVPAILDALGYPLSYRSFVRPRSPAPQAMRRLAAGKG